MVEDCFIIRRGRKRPSTVRDFWQPCGHPVLTGCGAQALLDVGLTAFFASCQCPGIAIRAAMDRALQQARAQHRGQRLSLAIGAVGVESVAGTGKGAFGGGECSADCAPPDAAARRGARWLGSWPTAWWWRMPARRVLWLHKLRGQCRNWLRSDGVQACAATHFIIFCPR